MLSGNLRPMDEEELFAWEDESRFKRSYQFSFGKKASLIALLPYNKADRYAKLQMPIYRTQTIHPT